LEYRLFDRGDRVTKAFGNSVPDVGTRLLRRWLNLALAEQIDDVTEVRFKF
jgi:hypothetical protein